MVFTASIVAGMAAGNAASTIIIRSICAFLAAWFVGGIVGSVAERVVNRDIQNYKMGNPVPETYNDLGISRVGSVDSETGEGEAEEIEEVGEVITATEELTSRPAA